MVMFFPRNTFGLKTEYQPAVVENRDAGIVSHCVKADDSQRVAPGALSI